MKQWPLTDKIYCTRDRTLKDVIADGVCNLFILVVFYNNLVLLLQMSEIISAVANKECAPYYLKSESGILSFALLVSCC